MKKKYSQYLSMEVTTNARGSSVYRTLMETVPDSHLDDLKSAPGFDWAYDTPLCPRQPVLDYLHQYVGRIDESIDGLFGLQHLLGSTATLIDKITAGRISPDNVFLLGKPYSANREVVRFLQEQRGYWVHPDTLEQPIDRSNDGEMDRRIKAVLDACRSRLQRHRESRKMENGDHRVLLIDDGGRAIRMLHSPEYVDICDHFVCVEQTRAGIRAIENIDLRVPVVNVAESWVKLEHESPMIAESVNRELTKQLTVMHNVGIPTGRSALIIGYGAIGRAVSTEMRRQGRSVAVYEPQEERRALANRDGFPLFKDLRTALTHAELIIGCTGKPVLNRDDYDYIPDGAILVSASSADIEFRGWQLRATAVPLGKPQSWQTVRRPIGHRFDGRVPDYDAHPCFCLYLVRSGGRNFYLVNGGFPVNFTGEIDPIPPQEIQLTRGLLYCGAFQASRSFSPGLKELDDWMQRRLLTVYHRLTMPHISGGALCLQSA